jgi:hypothetical protein
MEADIGPGGMNRESPCRPVPVLRPNIPSQSSTVSRQNAKIPQRKKTLTCYTTLNPGPPVETSFNIFLPSGYNTSK